MRAGETGLRRLLPRLKSWLQGGPKRALTSGQLALVFQELANATALPSTRPLPTRKSSLITLLKFPHRPADHTPEVKGGVPEHGQRFRGPRTSGASSDGGVG